MLYLMLRQPPEAVAELTAALTRGQLVRRRMLRCKAFQLASEGVARWLKVLTDRPGSWVSGSELEGIDTELIGARTDRLYRQLPGAIQKLIETKRGRGSRLMVA